MIFFVTRTGAINVTVVDITSYSLAVLLTRINALLVFGIEDTHVHEDLLSSREEPIGYSENKQIICPFTSHHQEPTRRTLYHFHVEDNQRLKQATSGQAVRRGAGGCSNT